MCKRIWTLNNYRKHTMGVTSEAETAYPSGEPELTPGF